MTHTVKIQPSPYGADVSQAVCSCSWRGQHWLRGEVCARREADEHKANPDAPANTWSLMGRLA